MALVISPNTSLLPLPSTTQTDTDYTLALTDAYTTVIMSSSSAHTLTVPPNGTIAFGIGTQIVIEQGGAAAVTIAPGAGVTLNGVSLVTAAQYTVLVLLKQATDTWLVTSGSVGFSQKKIQVFTSGSGTYTPTSGMRYCTVYCTGGGGASGDATNTDSVSGGGGAGGTAIKTYSSTDIGASKGYVVGAGGTRANPGGTGVNSTFGTGGTLITGSGGGGSTQSATATLWVAPGGVGGSASGGDINVVGQSGGIGVIATTAQGMGGTGGASFWGAGASAATPDTAGVAGTNYGSGAAGAHASGTTDRNGANGGSGVIYIEEYL